jgi:hypothetical protein
MASDEAEPIVEFAPDTSRAPAHRPAPTAAELRAQARRWRRLALSVDAQTGAQLDILGGELDSRADETER